MPEAVIMKNPLGTERIGKLIVKFAIPSIIAMVVNSLYNMVDQIFIGQGVGYLGNAATNIILPFTIVLMAIAMMVGDGAAAFLSLNLGKGEKERASRGVGNAIVLATGFGIILCVAFEVFLEPLCWLFGSTESIMPYVLDYGRIIVLGFPFFSLCCSLGSVIRADGRPLASMIGLLVGCIANIVLDPIFIFVFEWGVTGAAWATIIGQFLNAAFYIGCLFRFKSIALKKEHFIPKLRYCGRVMALGISSFLTQIAAVLVVYVVNVSLVEYGALSKYGAEIPLAAYGITMKVVQLVTGIALGIAVGVQPIIGFNYGSEQYDRVKRTYKLALLSTTLVLVAAFFIFQVFPEAIVSLFGKESDLYIEFAVLSFRIYTSFCFMIGFGLVTGVFFQAIGRPVQSAVLSLSRQVLFFVPAVLVMAYLLGVEGILWAGPISDGISAIVAMIVLRIYWNKIFPKGQKDE